MAVTPTQIDMLLNGTTVNLAASNTAPITPAATQTAPAVDPLAMLNTATVQPTLPATTAPTQSSSPYNQLFGADPNGFGYGALTDSNANTWRPMTPAESDLNKKTPPDEGLWGSIKQMISENKNQIISAGIKAAGDGVLEYLKARQQERAYKNALSHKYALDQQATNEMVRRSSTMPTMKSMINPNAAPQPGLLGQVVRS